MVNNLFYKNEELQRYIDDLSLVASLSNLFSESKIPLIYYRATENIYCHSFNATNISRNDCTADALYQNCGIGIKTFISSALTQKIAEFNKQRPLYEYKKGLDLISKISELRNERVDFTLRNYNLNSLFFHCIVRSEGTIAIHEIKMNRIDVSNLRIIDEDDKRVLFTDGIEEYEFMYSKSTLLMRFKLEHPLKTFKVNILNDPMEQLRILALSLLPSKSDLNIINGHYRKENETEFLVIPLYSKKGNVNYIPARSGLNQWNAKGRVRHENEVYIPYPAIIRRECPTFFPNRESRWEMKLPDGNILSMKICQQDGKAIMSDPNRALGKWLLREVLNLSPNQLLTYEKLLEIGVDSVVFKKEHGLYFIDFIEF